MTPISYLDLARSVYTATKETVLEKVTEGLKQGNIALDNLYNTTAANFQRQPGATTTVAVVALTALNLIGGSVVGSQRLYNAIKSTALIFFIFITVQYAVRSQTHTS